jgi:pyruvate ferredoxin oxidoreductase alpha subunit
MQQILEGSRAIAILIKNIEPAVVSAYPITPQTHIVEDLAKFKAEKKATYEYIRAESEFAAASIVAGASATGVRTYSATSSQGLLLMSEVVFNIAGLRLPIVMTVANRAVSAPINIWNDHQDAMTIRDAGWIMFFAENHQEAIEQHLLAYRLAEKLSLPAMVNVDGFILTHLYEAVEIPSAEKIKKYLPNYTPKLGTFLDPKNPVTLGAFATPNDYLEIRQDLHEDLSSSLTEIKREYDRYQTIFKTGQKANEFNNGLIEYYGSKNANTIIVALGSVCGTIKETIDNHKKVALLKIKTFRPWPKEEIAKLCSKAKQIAVIEKAISLGNSGPLFLEVKSTLTNKNKTKVQSFILGLGGRDITKKMISEVIKKVKEKNNDLHFIGKI